METMSRFEKAVANNTALAQRLVWFGRWGLKKQAQKLKVSDRRSIQGYLHIQYEKNDVVFLLSKHVNVLWWKITQLNISSQ